MLFKLYLDHLEYEINNNNNNNTSSVTHSFYMLNIILRGRRIETGINIQICHKRNRIGGYGVNPSGSV
jgi:hypothetical protein